VDPIYLSFKVTSQGLTNSHESTFDIALFANVGMFFTLRLLREIWPHFT